jgi:hypothetical protein
MAGMMAISRIREQTSSFVICQNPLSIFEHDKTQFRRRR